MRKRQQVRRAKSIIHFKFKTNLMKTMKITLIIAIAMLVTVSFTYAQSSKVYKDGSVWTVAFVKLKANMGDEYLTSLKTTWKATQEEAVKQGLIVSYKILSGVAANPEDWDIMLMVEYKNMAAMEGNDDKWDAIEKKVIGGAEAMKTINTNRVNVRDIYGGKLLHEIIYK
jgi:hypothetical protein